jgi:hypothetical protein
MPILRRRAQKEKEGKVGKRKVHWKVRSRHIGAAKRKQSHQSAFNSFILLFRSQGSNKKGAGSSHPNN